MSEIRKSNLVQLVKNWWLLLLIGILLIFGATWMMITPVAGFAGIVLLFSSLIFVSGLLSIFFALSNRKEIDNWGLYISGGILDMVVGFILLKHPGAAVIVFSLVIGFWLLFRGGSTISTAFKMKNDGYTNWGWILALGIFTVIFALLAILYQPLLGGAYLAFLLAFAFLLLGTAYIFIAFKLKQFKGHVSDLKDEIEDIEEEVMDRLKGRP